MYFIGLLYFLDWFYSIFEFSNCCYFLFNDKCEVSNILGQSFFLVKLTTSIKVHAMHENISGEMAKSAVMQKW